MVTRTGYSCIIDLPRSSKSYPEWERNSGATILRVIYTWVAFHCELSGRRPFDTNSTFLAGEFKLQNLHFILFFRDVIKISISYDDCLLESVYIGRFDRGSSKQGSPQPAESRSKGHREIVSKPHKVYKYKYKYN